jgi:predicted Zn finger-like uncharacterized protein
MFRVTPPQLQAQHGMVRCGQCAHVFDGYKTMATLPDTGQVSTPPASRDAAPAAVPDIDQVVSRAANIAPISPQIAERAIENPVTYAPPLQPVPEDASAQHQIDPPPFPPVLDPAMARPGIDDVPTAPYHPPEDQSRSGDRAPEVKFEPLPDAQDDFGVISKRTRSGGWAFGVLLLLLGLAAQGVYFFRGDIAARVPEARPHLARMCEFLRCTVALPQRPREISIEASDLQATDPARPGLIALTATLRNNATTEIGYPALDVVLTNTKDHTVARRIFLPAEYLVAGKNTRAGITPNAEFTVRLDVDTGDLGAVGFRLGLLAAP